MTDEDLVRRLAADDGGALEDAYRAHAPRCRAIAARALRDPELAQDAVQEAFLALWRHRAGLVVKNAGIGAWLTVVTRNAALNIARGGARRTLRETAHAPADAPEDPETTALARVDAAGVRAALGRLPDEQRRVIALAYFGGKTLAEIASTTGAPLGTVKRRAQLALTRLARMLGDHRS